MKKSNNLWSIGAATGALCGVAIVSGAFAPAASAQAAAAAKATAPISLDLRDAPIRQALEQLFSSAGVQYSIDNSVAGFVTLKIVDQPFDNALRVLLRSSSQPLSYTSENGVYFVKPRPAPTADTTQTAAPEVVQDDAKNSLPLEQIQLTYIDSYDLQGILGVVVLPNFLRGQRVAGAGGRGGGGGGIGGGGGGVGGF